MPTLADLLSDEDAKRLNAAIHPTKAVPQPGTTSKRPGAPRTVAVKGPAVVESIDPLLLQCGCERRHDGFTYVGDVLVHKACGSPRKDVAVVRGARVNPRTMPCAGCTATVTVAKRPEQANQDLERERLVVCADCAKTMSEGSTITVVAPRPHHSETGGARAAVTVSNINKEPPVPTIDIDDVTDAQLGAEVRKTMKAKAAKSAKAKAKKAKKAGKDTNAGKRKDRKDLTAVGTLLGFNFKGVEVPDLEVGAIPSIDEAPAAKHRSPYNKCRARNGEATHPYKDEPSIGVTACTWADLIADHQRFTQMAGLGGLVKPDAKPVKAQIAAPIDLGEKAKVKAICKAMGVDKATARKMLAAVQ